MVPTTTIGQQLVADCKKLGIGAVSGAQVMLNPARPGLFVTLETRGGGADVPSPCKNGSCGWEVSKLELELILSAIPI